MAKKRSSRGIGCAAKLALTALIVMSAQSLIVQYGSGEKFIVIGSGILPAGHLDDVGGGTEFNTSLALND